jgi:pyruvate dehydrogenase (quinone)
VGFGVSKAKEGLQALTGDKSQWENLKKELKSYFD